VEYTNEAGCWGKAAFQKENQPRHEYAYAAQRLDYLTNPDGTPPQNPLMRITSWRIAIAMNRAYRRFAG
jgi:hypothetical protein